MSKFNTNSKTIVLKDVEINWAHVQEPEKTYGKYSVDITITDEIKKILEAEGLAQHIKDPNYKYNTNPPTKRDKPDSLERTAIIKVSRPSKTQAGKEVPPPQIVDSKKNPISDLLGNGTRANVAIRAYDHENANGGRTMQLVGVQVLDLVPYGDAASAFDVEDGYTAEEDEAPFDTAEAI